MAVNAIEDFFPFVRISAEGCSDDIIREAVRDSAIRLCTDAWIIREDLPAQDINIITDIYTVDPSDPTNYETVGVTSMQYDKRDLDRKTEEELDIIDQGWRTADPGPATYWFQTAPNVIRFNRIAKDAITNGLAVKVATRPTDTALQLDSELFRDWRRAIQYGALNLILEIPGKKWSSDKKSERYGMKFNFEIQRARARARMNYMSKPSRAQQPAWL